MALSQSSEDQSRAGSAMNFKGHAPELGPYSNHRWLAINGVEAKSKSRSKSPENSAAEEWRVQ